MTGSDDLCEYEHLRVLLMCCGGATKSSDIDLLAQEPSIFTIGLFLAMCQLFRANITRFKNKKVPSQCVPDVFKVPLKDACVSCLKQNEDK